MVSRNFWLVPANAEYHLAKLPREAFVDLRAVILPAGTSLENEVLVHINVPAKDLPYGLSTISLETNQSFDLPEVPPMVPGMSDALPAANVSAALPALPASESSPAFTPLATPQGRLALTPHAADEPSTDDTQPATKKQRILQVKNSDEGELEETFERLAGALIHACQITNFASADRHDPKSFKGVLKKFVAHVLKSSWSSENYPEEARVFIGMANERLIESVLSEDVTAQAKHAFFGKDLPEIIDTLQPAFELAPFLFPKRYAPVVSIARYDYLADQGVHWGNLGTCKQMDFQRTVFFEKWNEFRTKRILHLLLDGKIEGEEDRASKIELCAAKSHHLDEKEQAKLKVLKASAAKQKKPAPVEKGSAPTKAGPTDATGEPKGVAEETKEVETVTPLEQVEADRTHIGTADGSHPSEAAAPMFDGTDAATEARDPAPAAISEVIADEAANEGACAAKHAIREGGEEVAQILPEPVIAEDVESTIAIGPT